MKPLDRLLQWKLGLQITQTTGAVTAKSDVLHECQRINLILLVVKRIKDRQLSASNLVKRANEPKYRLFLDFDYIFDNI